MGCRLSREDPPPPSTPRPPAAVYYRYLDLVRASALKAGVLRPLPTVDAMAELLALCDRGLTPAAALVVRCTHAAVRGGATPLSSAAV